MIRRRFGPCGKSAAPLALGNGSATRNVLYTMYMPCSHSPKFIGFFHAPIVIIAGFISAAPWAHAQSIGLPWSGHGHDPQHTGLSQVACQPLNRILWQTPVDLNPQYSGNELLIHYGSPLVTRQNTVVIPVKTGASSGFQVEAHKAGTGEVLWIQPTD
jgi:hypothetical protein